MFMHVREFVRDIFCIFQKLIYLGVFNKTNFKRVIEISGIF